MSALTECTDLIEKYELTHSSAKIIRNKILNVADAFKFVDLIDLKESFVSSQQKIIFNISTRQKKFIIEINKQKKSAVDKSIRLRKIFASSSAKRSRGRSFKCFQSKKKTSLA